MLKRIKSYFYFFVFVLSAYSAYKIFKYFQRESFHRKIKKMDEVSKKVDDVDKVVGIKFMEAKIYLEKLKQMDKAIAELSALLDEYPENIFTDAIIFDLARAYEMKNDNEQAKKYYSLIVDNYKDSAFWKESYDKIKK